MPRLLPALALLAAPAFAAELSFNRDIRPILSEHCYACHGFDKNTRKADLRLDTLEGATADHDGSRAIVPGKPDASAALERMLSTDPEELMPPPKMKKPLQPAQIAVLKQWISEGAKYEKHWAFTPPTRPTVPEVKTPAWPRNAVDRFILARLDRDHLAPSPEADKTTLLRRVTYDLTGLPPTLAELDAFLADPAPDAYEKVVDRLLASPRYGEKMAVHWLDLSRYADTHGYHLDSGRDMWPWRDWVIAAFNKNLPFDQFTRWQLAGDLLPKATPEQRLATGFVRNNMINFEGGAIAAEYLNNYLVDRVNTVSTVFLGLTVACAQCHDHKYDPISHKEYYQLYAYFNAVPENGLDGSRGNAAPVMKVPDAGTAARLLAAREKLAAAERALGTAETALEPAAQAWLATQASARPPAWQPVTPLSAETSAQRAAAIAADGSAYFGGDLAATDGYILTARTTATGLLGVRLEALTDPRLVGGGPGGATNGNFVLTDFDVEAVSLADPAKKQTIRFSAAQADYEQANFGVALAIDAKPASGWAVDGNVKHEPRTAWFTAPQPFGYPGGTELHFRLKFGGGYDRHVIARPRVAVTSDPAALRDLRTTPEFAQLATIPPARQTPAQHAQLRRHYGTVVTPTLAAPLAEIERCQKAVAALEKAEPTVMVMAQMDRPRPTNIRLRGDYATLGDLVEPGVPAALGALPADAPQDRRSLADWLTNPRHPLLARVTVNRLWKNLFGTGIVKTVNDFGLQGEWPSHPELLDWLAVEFADRGWDVKGMVRLLVTSATYRQSARVLPLHREHDPENRLYARGPRFRLSAEEIRDTALAASGLLNPTIGGPSVYPYQPAGLWEELSSREDSRNWTAQFFEQSHGADLYRRSIYTFWKRTCPPPQMLTFDAPDREVCTAQRDRTNTPLQALVTLNDPTYLEAARILAEKVLAQGGKTPAERIAFAFRLSTARPPTARESALLTTLLAAQQRRFAAQPEAARKFLQTGEMARNAQLDPAEVAAWTIVASTILNLDETLTRG